MLRYFLWFFALFFIAIGANLGYSLFGIANLNEYLAVVGIVGFLAIIFSIIGLRVFLWIRLKFLVDFIFKPIYIIGFILTGALTIVYPTTSIIKVGTAFYETITTDSNYEEYVDYDDYSNGDFPIKSNTGIHHVDPHWVNGYERADGTKVEGYWRGGKDGYERSNPDGSTENNLNSGGSVTGILDWLGW